MNFQEAVEAYNEARHALSTRRAQLKAVEAEVAWAKRALLSAETGLTESRQFEARAAKHLLELAAKVPGLLHADVSGIIGKRSPAEDVAEVTGSERASYHAYPVACQSSRAVTDAPSGTLARLRRATSKRGVEEQSPSSGHQHRGDRLGRRPRARRHRHLKANEFGLPCLGHEQVKPSALSLHGDSPAWGVCRRFLPDAAPLVSQAGQPTHGQRQPGPLLSTSGWRELLSWLWPPRHRQHGRLESGLRLPVTHFTPWCRP